MDQKPQPLSYARPMEKEFRPPTYALILTVLIAGIVIMLGIIATVVFAVVLADSGGSVFSLIPLLVAALFLYIGSRSMGVAVRFLRGLPPTVEDWDRWMFWIWMTRM